MYQRVQDSCSSGQQPGYLVRSILNPAVHDNWARSGGFSRWTTGVEEGRAMFWGEWCQWAGGLRGSKNLEPTSM